MKSPHDLTERRHFQRSYSVRKAWSTQHGSSVHQKVTKQYRGLIQGSGQTYLAWVHQYAKPGTYAWKLGLNSASHGTTPTFSFNKANSKARDEIFNLGIDLELITSFFFFFSQSNKSRFLWKKFTWDIIAFVSKMISEEGEKTVDIIDSTCHDGKSARSELIQDSSDITLSVRRQSRHAQYS